MAKLISEGLSSDGSFQLQRLFVEANKRLGKLGKHGKRAKLKQSGNSISLQFSFHGQQQKGCGCNFTKKGIAEAEKIAQLVTTQLSANSFSWDWFYCLVGKKIEVEEPKQTCSKIIADYKSYWFKENTHLKNPQGCWYQRFRYAEKIMSERDEELDLNTVREIIEQTENNSTTRTYVLQALTLILEYCDIFDYDKKINAYKSKNNPVVKKRSVPSDGKIQAVFKEIVPPASASKKYLYRYPQWRFLYGLLATYGLRVHEAWCIANWDKPVMLHKGDWLVTEESFDGEEDRYEQYTGGEFVIPAILDPANTDKILCIGHNTKTGYRMAMPLSPEGENWIETFNLIQPLNLPDIKNPTVRNSMGGSPPCTRITCNWFRRHKYGFTPHDLRHAYNHRGHELGYNPTLLSKSLGHSLQMNTNNYLRTMADSRNLGMIKNAIVKEKEKRSQLERLTIKVESLEQENERLKTEISLYKSLLEQVKLK